MPKGAYKLTDEHEDLVYQTMRKAHGVKTSAAKALSVDRGTLAKYIEDRPDLKLKLREVDDELLDLAENRVHKALNDSDGKMVRWFLDAKGGRRGYGRRVDVSIDAPIGPIGDAMAMLDLTKLTDEEQIQFLELYRKAQADPGMIDVTPEEREAGGKGDDQPALE